MKPRIIKKKVVTYEYNVIDNYNKVHNFNNEAEAAIYLGFCLTEKKILSNIKPSGVTLVVSRNPNVYYKCIAAFIGYNGIPFCEANKDKGRDFFYNHFNGIEDSYSTIHGDMVTVMKKAYALLNGKSFLADEFCVDADEAHWVNGVYWYNWDGKHFKTNDKKCQLKDEDFI